MSNTYTSATKKGPELIFEEFCLTPLDDLPEPALNLVMDYLRFLKWHGADDEPSLLSVAGALSGTPLSAEEIESELYGATESR
jgi:hypothetical protein